MSSKHLLIGMIAALAAALALAAWLLVPGATESNPTSNPVEEGTKPADSEPLDVERRQQEIPEPSAELPDDAQALVGTVRDEDGTLPVGAEVQLFLVAPPLSSTSLRGTMDKLQQTPWGPAEPSLEAATATTASPEDAPELRIPITLRKDG